MTASTRCELRSAATSTSTTAIGLIRALTDARPIKPTSTRRLSARRPNPAEAPLIDAEILFRQPQPPHRLQTAVAALLLGIFWTIITFNQIIRTYTETSMPADDTLDFGTLVALFAPLVAAIAMLLVLPLILLSTAPAKAVSRRLLFILIGLILLIALNELSKLGLDVTAPKLQG